MTVGSLNGLDKADVKQLLGGGFQKVGLKHDQGDVQCVCARARVCVHVLKMYLGNGRLLLAMLFFQNKQTRLHCDLLYKRTIHDVGEFHIGGGTIISY